MEDGMFWTKANGKNQGKLSCPWPIWAYGTRTMVCPYVSDSTFNVQLQNCFSFSWTWLWHMIMREEVIFFS